MLLNKLVLSLVIVFLSVNQSTQHAYLSEPPSRASAWLTDHDFAQCCSNYDYNQMFCGGAQNQWGKNGGKCGICGDPYDQEEPRTYEKGGEKYLGKIVRSYQKGDQIPVTVQITANHLGYFEFRICNVDGWENDASQECLNQTVLNIQESQNHKYSISKDMNTVRLNLNLPSNFKCNHCVLQWKYVTGNSWGYDPDRNVSCLGCGPVQEHFFGCSDISILGSGDEEVNESSSSSTSISTSVISSSSTESEYPSSSYVSSTQLITESTTPIFTTTEPIPDLSSEILTTTPLTTTTIESTTTTEIIETAEIIETTEIIPSTTTTESIDSSSSETTSTSLSPTTTTQSDEDPIIYKSCKLKLEFGSKVNISRIVSIYCYRMCKLKCRTIMEEYQRSIRRIMDSDIIACLETCPVLCDCI